MKKSGHANVIHYGSPKSKRVTRSVFVLELLAMAHGFNISSSIRLTSNAIIDRVIALHVNTESQFLYDCLVRIN